MPPHLEAIEELYEHAFGPIVDSLPERFFEGERPGIDEDTDEAEEERIHAAFDAAPRFERILCWDGSSPGALAVYASLGAMHLPAAHEMFVVAPAPFAGLGEIVNHILSARTTPIRALEVISCAVPEMSFEAVLLAPVADGLVLGVIGGAVRHALRAIPLTRAERGLAEDEPEQALALLRAAGAFTPHPLRDCLLEPQRTRALRRKLEAQLYAQTGRRYYNAVESRARIREMATSDERRLRAALAEHPDDSEAAAEIRERFAQIKIPSEMLDEAELLVAERHAVLMYLDAPGGPPPADRHVPYALHRAVPPEAARVALRAQVHAAVLARGRVEDGITRGGERARERLVARVDMAGLRAELEPHEAALLDAPFGSLQEDARVSLHGQALLVFAWALHIVEQPPHDQRGKLRAMFTAHGEALPPLASPRLRSLDARMAYLNLAHALLWRIHTLEISPGPMDVLSAASGEGFWFGSLSFDGIPLVAGDVAVDGRPIHEASPERVKLLRSIALGRLRAASWLVGLHPLYSETPASIY
jgi:hypothetical protein